MDPTTLTYAPVGAVKNTAIQEAIPIRYCLYSRKSSEDDEKQSLSIESQIREMATLANRDGLEIADIKRESHSAKASGQRPIFNELLEDIRKGKFDGILTWAPDRLSRNAGDLGSVVDLMDQGKLKEIRTYGQKFINSPNEKFLLMILCSQAKLENDNKSINVKRGLKTKAEMGLWPCLAPIGYVNEKTKGREGCLILDPIRAPVIKQMFEKVAHEQWSGRQIFTWLKDDLRFKAQRGGKLNLSTIHIALRNPFYTGIFEYPKGSGKWYAGKHQPIISKDLFEKAREIINDRNQSGSIKQEKEFAFTKLMKCGLCGSGISATEKIKYQKNGNVHQYIYYGCTKARDKYCKCGYIREDRLIEGLLKIIDAINVDELGIKEHLKQELERHRKFMHGVLGMDGKDGGDKKGVDTKNYVKYVLREGNLYEKREIMACFKSRVVIKQKTVSLE